MDKLVSSSQQCPVYVHKALRAQSGLLNGTGFEICTCKLFAFFGRSTGLARCFCFCQLVLTASSPKKLSRDVIVRPRVVPGKSTIICEGGSNVNGSKPL